MGKYERSTRSNYAGNEVTVRETYLDFDEIEALDDECDGLGYTHGVQMRLEKLRERTARVDVAPRTRQRKHAQSARNRLFADRVAAEGMVATMTDAHWVMALEFFERRCIYCQGRPLVLHMDHVMALSQGGNHCPHNVVPACGPCNSSKHANDLLEWLERRTDLDAAAVYGRLGRYLDFLASKGIKPSGAVPLNGVGRAFE